MATRRELIEAEDFQRRRGVAALERGDPLAVEDVPRRPNAALVAGLVIVVLIAAGSAVTAYLQDRPPSNWRAEDTLVVDQDTGARYVVTDGVLRPTPTLTAALLAGGRPHPVLVPHARVVEAGTGLPLPGPTSPEAPPVVPERQPSLTACATSPAAVDVFAGRPAGTPSPTTGMLVRTPEDPTPVLLTRQRAFPLAPAALFALGYAPAQVRVVPSAWLAVAPAGPFLAPVALPPGARTVSAAGSGRRFVVQDGTARPVLGDTTARLLPPPSSTVPDAALAALPPGPPVGAPEAPGDVPTVPRPDVPAVPCVADGGTPAVGLVFASRIGETAATRAAPPRVLADGVLRVAVTWHLPPDQGALLGPPDLDRPRPPEEADLRDAGIVLVADGVGHPTDLSALERLGYHRGQVVLVPVPWFGLLQSGPALTASG